MLPVGRRSVRLRTTTQKKPERRGLRGGRERAERRGQRHSDNDEAFQRNHMSVRVIVNEAMGQWGNAAITSSLPHCPIAPLSHCRAIIRQCAWGPTPTRAAAPHLEDSLG